jgi:hypothetical protein
VAPVPLGMSDCFVANDRMRCGVTGPSAPDMLLVLEQPADVGAFPVAIQRLLSGLNGRKRASSEAVFPRCLGRGHTRLPATQGSLVQGRMLLAEQADLGDTLRLVRVALEKQDTASILG